MIDALISSVHVAGAEFSSTAGILPEVCGKGVVQLRVLFWFILQARGCDTFLMQFEAILIFWTPSKSEIWKRVFLKTSWYLKLDSRRFHVTFCIYVMFLCNNSIAVSRYLCETQEPWFKIYSILCIRYLHLDRWGGPHNSAPEVVWNTSPIRVFSCVGPFRVCKSLVWIKKSTAKKLGLIFLLEKQFLHILLTYDIYVYIYIYRATCQYSPRRSTGFLFFLLFLFHWFGFTSTPTNPLSPGTEV